MWATARLGLLITLAATVAASLVTWFIVRNHPLAIRLEAHLTAAILPLILAPICIFFNNRQAFRNHRLMLEVTRLAHTDEMTGLANRRSFMREAAERLTSTDFETDGLCMFIVDLDHFKSVNDRYGHCAGDETLIHVAARMEQAVPAGTLIARLGGEEFAILLPFKQFSDIHDQAEKLRQSVANYPCRFEGETISATISVGIGIAHGEDTVSSVLSRADCALYAAKDEGRNRFSIAA